MIYQTFGPFQIWLDRNGNIPDDLDEFWDQVDDSVEGLSSAKGCYVFGIKTSGATSVYPWYVGKTNSSFNAECFQPHKLVIYARSKSVYRRANPYLFLIPRFTDGGAFYKGSGDASTDFLERHLISLALQANPNLMNKRDTKLYREVRLRGILNSPGKPDKASSELKHTLELP